MSTPVAIRYNAIKNLTDRKASGLTFRVFDYFVTNADENGQVRTTMAEMAPKFDRGVPSMNNCIKSLIESGVLEMERIPREPSIYTLRGVFPDRGYRDVA